MKHLRALFVLALVVGFAVPAFAETQNVKVSGSIDAYWFYRINYDLQDNNDSGAIPAGSAVPGSGGTTNLTGHSSEADDYFRSNTQIEVSADLTDNVSTVINLVNQRDWNADDFVAETAVGTNTTPSEFDIILDLAYVQMKEIFYSPLTLTIGRQDLWFGRGFIIGNNNAAWDTQGIVQANEYAVTTAFDALRATLDFNPWTIDFVFSKIQEGAHDPEDDRDLWIANVNYKFAEYNAVAEGYYVGEFDRNALTTAGSSTVNDSGGTRDNDTNTLGGRIQFDPISQITLGGELAYQFGSYRAAKAAAAVFPEDRDRQAWAADIFAEYRWDNTWKPMAGIEYIYMSGETDLGAASTQSYGAWNAPFRGPTYGWIHEYLETNYATSDAGDQSAGQNHESISIYGSLKPLEDLLLSARYYYFWTPEAIHTLATDPNTGSRDSELGHEIDTTVSYSYTEDVTFNFMANWFIPGGFYENPNDATASEYISEVKVTF